MDRETFEKRNPEVGELRTGIQKLKDRITELEEALIHLLEVQTAPSFHKGEDTKLYEKQKKEWRAAVDHARLTLRRKP